MVAPALAAAPPKLPPGIHPILGPLPSSPQDLLSPGEVLNPAAAAAAGAEPAAGGGLRLRRGARRVSLTVRHAVMAAGGREGRIETPAARDEARRRAAWWVASRGEDGLRRL